MSLHTIIARSEKFVADNSPLILTGIGAAGVLTTAYLTGKATIKACAILEDDWPNAEQRASRPKTETIKRVWTLYLPAAGVASFTIAAIILANRIDSRRMAALAAGIAVSDRALSEYKDKVTETLGKKKAKEIRDEVATDKLKGRNFSNVEIPEGHVLMLEPFTQKPFTSSMEKVRKVENDLREILLNPASTVTITDWLKGIGMKRTPYSDDFGWNGASGFKLDYAAGLTDDEKPAITWYFAVDPLYRPEPTDRFQI